MRRLALALVLAAFATAPASAARPLSGNALLAIDAKALYRNFLPTS